MIVLLDTHAILWWQAGSGRLSARAAREIARADTVLVSPISCWEIGILLGKGRIALDRDVQQWVRDLLAQIVEAARELGRVEGRKKDAQVPARERIGVRAGNGRLRRTGGKEKRIEKIKVHACGALSGRPRAVKKRGAEDAGIVPSGRRRGFFIWGSAPP